MKCFNYYLSAILALLAITAKAKSDSLIVHENYVIYRGDTFNLKDKNGLLQGKGIIFKIDSSKVITGGISNSCSFGTDKKCESTINKTNSYTLYKYKVVAIGQYFNNKKEGIWYYSSSANISHIDAEVLYQNDEIVWIDTFEKQHELVYRIEKSEKGFLCYKWDMIEKRYLNVATEMVTLIKYSYNIK